jgi:hypothetical protein
MTKQPKATPPIAITADPTIPYAEGAITTPAPVFVPEEAVGEAALLEDPVFDPPVEAGPPVEVAVEPPAVTVKTPP